MEAFKIKNGISATRYLGSSGADGSGSEGYDLSAAEYDNKSFSVASQETTPQGLFFKPDGLKVYVVGSASDSVHEYNLGTAWDISTSSFVHSFSLAGQDNSPTGVFLKPDGNTLYITGQENDNVYAYSLSTAWDISTATLSQSFSVSSQDTSPREAFFKPDGTKMYVLGDAGTDVNEYDLSTSWDISTASFLQNFSVSSQEISPNGLFFKPDGTSMYVSGGSGQEINEYDLSTAWNISTASFSRVFSVSAQDTTPSGVVFKSDGTKMYIVGGLNDSIFQYSTALLTQTLDLSTGTTFSFTPSGATTVSFTNPPASGNAIGFSVEINGDGSAITWPSSVKWDLATAPVATASKELYTFVTVDGGTTYYGKKAAEGVA